MEVFRIASWIRIIHYYEIFRPAHSLIMMKAQHGKRRGEEMTQFYILFATIFIMGHIMACFWIALGEMYPE